MKKILIIEDDQMVANIYRNKFSVEGFQVDIAHDGVSGLESIRTFRPDAVVLDLMLPKMTGVELMKQVRSEPQFQTLPIIVFSNTYLSNLVQDAWKAGATKCLSKANCSPKQLLEVVRGSLSGIGSSPAPAGATEEPPLSKQAAEAKAPSAPAAPTVPDEAAFQAELRGDFARGLPAALGTLRTHLQALIKAADEATQRKSIEEMYKRIHGITSNAGMTGMHNLAQLSDALEALLKELHEKPKNLNASTLRTVASAVDFLGALSARDLEPEQHHKPPPRVLVVDDEAISRRAVTYALERAKLKPTAIESAEAAYKLLIENKYDLVFLDVDMPGMNGFELCSKLRQLPAHKTTPVVFVTSLNDLESRANSTMSGGNDFIAKPFLFLELTVKALVYLLRARPAAGK
ncbi:MAG TPA: response regulator [Verrucomicrobiae bacterium]|nr:response regulator [Verrucomicrobiae bacterium]